MKLNISAPITEIKNIKIQRENNLFIINKSKKCKKQTIRHIQYLSFKQLKNPTFTLSFKHNFKVKLHHYSSKSVVIKHRMKWSKISAKVNLS